jgi:hypothetical protein
MLLAFCLCRVKLENKCSRVSGKSERAAYSLDLKLIIIHDGGWRGGVADIIRFICPTDGGSGQTKHASCKSRFCSPFYTRPHQTPCLARVTNIARTIFRKVLSAITCKYINENKNTMVTISCLLSIMY